mgnify:FL=1
MAEHLLNVADIDVGFEEAGGEGMAEHVRGDVQVDGGEGAIFVYHAAHGLVGQGRAGLVHKKVCGGGDFGGKTAAVFHENVDNVVGGKLDIAFLVAFAVYEYGSVDEVYILVFQAAKLAYSYAGGEQELDYGGIAERISALVGSVRVCLLVVNDGEKGFDGVQRYCLWEDNWFAETGLYLGKRSALDDILVFTVMKKSLQRGDFALGSFGLVLTVKPAYIGFKSGRGDVGYGCKAGGVG